jgi:serine/threonine protein kinase
MINKSISHYKIIEKLGEGGMGVVYKAQDTKLDRPVAIKFPPRDLCCDPKAKNRFIQEAKSASAMNHPNITIIHDIDEVEGEFFIVMEYIEGKSIKEILQEKDFKLEEVFNIAIQAAEGLKAAHLKGIIHGDIKSDNLMLTKEGRVKITDFGLARLKGTTQCTDGEGISGTTAYMSPEQASGEDIDQRSDIFSFGVVLYEMITGQLPFSGEHYATIIYSILHETPEPLTNFSANVPEGLQRIVDKALVKDKNERYQHVDDLLADLKREKRNKGDKL